MTVRQLRDACIARDGGCMAPVLDPDAGPCRDRYGDPFVTARAGRYDPLEMDYQRRGCHGPRHVLEDDHLMLCGFHHQGSRAGHVWAHAHRELMRDHLDSLYGYYPFDE